MGIQFKDGQILFVGTEIAMDPACCCSGECPTFPTTLSISISSTEWTTTFALTVTGSGAGGFIMEAGSLPDGNPGIKEYAVLYQLPTYPCAVLQVEKYMENSDATINPIDAINSYTDGPIDYPGVNSNLMGIWLGDFGRGYNSTFNNYMMVHYPNPSSAGTAYYPTFTLSTP